MLRVALVLHLVVGSSLAGTFIIAALVVGVDALWPILGLGVVGYVLAVPLSWYIARAMVGDT